MFLWEVFSYPSEKREGTENAERKPGLIRAMLRRCVCTARNVDTRDTSTPCACRTRRARVEATAGSSLQATLLSSPTPTCSSLSRHPRARPHAPRGRYYGPKHSPLSADDVLPRARDSSEVRRDTAFCR